MRMVMQMNKIKMMLQSFQTIHVQTKRLLRFCTLYTLIIVFTSLALCLLAGRGINYYAAMLWAKDLFATVRPCVGITALGGLLTEGVLHTE